ncbi:MAG: hypothetical protein IJ428_02475 [Clostridia bacterium]|nr:hypothetical protein [Clostridia bacterium]
MNNMFLTAATGLDGFISSITGALGDFSVSNLGIVLVAAIGIAAPLVLAWFAFRKVRNAATGGLKKGKL